jgi:hypothetical protein
MSNIEVADDSVRPVCSVGDGVVLFLQTFLPGLAGKKGHEARRGHKPHIPSLTGLIIPGIDRSTHISSLTGLAIL